MNLDKEILDSLEELPTLPTIYTTLLEVMGNPRSTVADVADVITQDQSATAKVLKTINSSIYGLEKRIETISEAVFYLGFNEIKNLIIALSVISMFSKTKSINNFNFVDLWKHSIGVGIITRSIGKAAGVKNVENFFLAGILHDIGKLVLFKFFNQEYQKVISYVAEKDCTLYEAENIILNINHNLLGDFIALKWKLPLSIRLSIKHHKTGLVDTRPDIEVASVHVANITARLLEFGYGGDPYVPQPNPEIWRIINLPENYFTKNLGNFSRDYEQATSIFQLSD